MQTVKTQLLRFHGGVRILLEMNDQPFVLYSNKEAGYIRPVFQEITEAKLKINGLIYLVEES